ncbi:MAG: hypothetical protein Kow002_06210 [Anaerolineales bacterium]
MAGLTLRVMAIVFFMGIIAFVNTLKKITPIVLFLSFVLLTLPGLEWGAPGSWNPDEIVFKVDWAFHGKMDYFDLKNFDYPSLPKYIMLGLGKIVYGLGYSKYEFIMAARVLSALLGGLIVVLTYHLAQRMKLAYPYALLTGLLMLSAGILVQNAHYAHNDLYMLLFALLSVHALFSYMETKNEAKKRLWLYAAFILAGFALSSKYNGVVVIPLVVFVYLLMENKALLQDRLRTVETLFISAVLTFSAYALGTPRAILDASFYFRNMLPSFFRHGAFGHRPGVPRGIIGQWGVIIEAYGWLFFILGIAALAWTVVRLIQALRAKQWGQRENQLLVLFLFVGLVDFPIWFSYNYQGRFFLPLLPPLAVLIAATMSDVSKRWQANIAWGFAAWVIVVGFMRVGSIILLFMNDARIPASAYTSTFAEKSRVEVTLYPPNVAEDRKLKVRDYPIYIVKFIEQKPAPESGFNLGEAGLLQRDVDYLILDSFTYGRFSDPFICENNQVECDFFDDLFNGQSSYKLLKAFPAYELPWFMPQVRLDFVNPSIMIFQRGE